MHVSIFGAGSVGLCLAAHFARAGAQVTLLARKASLPKLEGTPLHVEGLLGTHDIAAEKITLCDAAEPTAAVCASDMLLVTTKAYDLAGALAPFAAAGRCPPVLLLQNGLGSAEVARKVLGPDVPVYSTAMMIGMVRTAPGRVGVTAQSSPIQCGALLGDDEAPLKALLALSEHGFVPMSHDARIRETIAFKLLFNTCMNPTGALTGQSYGELLTNPHSRALITGLAEETLAAFAAVYAYRPAESGAAYVDEVLSKIVFPRSAPHRSSMLQDLQAGRKTEIDFLNGAVIRLAQDAGLTAPRHEAITQLVKACEAAEAV